MTNWASQIEADLTWREGELASIKLLAASAASKSDKQRALLRALWTMLYAHYEGFSKFCWDLLLTEIEKDGCMRKDAIECMTILSLSKVFKTFRKNVSPPSIWEFVNLELPKQLNMPLVFPDRLETKSNLWPELAKENNAAVGIACPELEAHEQHIKSLVGRRNEIAHGKKLVVESLEEYANYERAAFLVMHELALGVVEQLENRAFAIT